MLSLEFFAMGCQMQAICQLPNTTAHPPMAEQLATIASHFAQAEQRFSRFLPDSELNQLNQLQRLKQRRTMAVSPPFWQLLQHALASAELTQGLISPTLLKPLLERGYRQDFRQLEQTDLTQITPLQIVPSQITMPNALTDLPTWQAIDLEPTFHQVSLPPDMGLDFGGFAKGLTAWDGATDFAKNGSVPVLIDAGGDIVTHGAKTGEPDKATTWQNWQVELPSVADIALPIEHLTALPTDWQDLAEWQCVANNALPLTLDLPFQHSYTLATSGMDYRFWFDGDGLQHHLIDPTGAPHSDIVCASVLIEDGQTFTHPAIQRFLQYSNRCNLAQTLSKLFCLLGVKKSRDWQQRFGLEAIGVSWLVFDTKNLAFQQWLNPVMQRFLHA